MNRKFIIPATVIMLTTGCALYSQPLCVLAADTNAGASAAISETVADTTDTNAGVSAALSASLELATSDLNSGGTDSASSETATDNYGYTNLGIASVDGSLNVREEASTDAETVGKMSDGHACEILAEEDGWYQIISGEVEGWVKSEYILTGEEAEAVAAEEVTTIATVNCDTLYAREEPSTDSKVYYLLGNGEELTVKKQLDGWVKVEVDDDKVYVASEYVEISEELPTALTMSEVKYGEGVSDVRVDLVNFATQFVGNPYVWGGVSLTNGCDCSGFVLSVYANYGIGLPHSSSAQSNYGTKIDASEAQPGDLFFYGSGSSISHVAIYIGNGQIVHASNHKDGIKISNAFYRSPITVRSLLD